MLRRLFDALALTLFPLWARLQGYRFIAASTPEKIADARRVQGTLYSSLGISPVPDLVEWGQKYNHAAQSFVAYHHSQAVGTLSLLDISIASVVFDVIPVTLPPSVRRDCVWEIGRLAIEASSRGRSNIVMIGLLREMVLFSRRRGIYHWIAFSTRTVFRLARHFNPSARLLPEDRSTAPDPTALRYVADYLRTIGARPVVYLMDANGFSPWAVFRQHLSARAAAWTGWRRPGRVTLTA